MNVFTEEISENSKSSEDESIDKAGDKGSDGGNGDGVWEHKEDDTINDEEDLQSQRYFK